MTGKSIYECEAENDVIDEYLEAGIKGGKKKMETQLIDYHPLRDDPTIQAWLKRTLEEVNKTLDEVHRKRNLEIKPQAVKPMEVKKVEVKPIEIKKVEVKPIEVKKVEVKPKIAEPKKVKQSHNKKYAKAGGKTNGNRKNK